jgi:hypothetical protein
LNHIQNGQVFVAKAAEVTAEGVSLILPGQSTATQKYYRRVAIGGAVSAGDLVLVARSSGTYVVIGAVTAGEEGG